MPRAPEPPGVLACGVGCSSWLLPYQYLNLDLAEARGGGRGGWECARGAVSTITLSELFFSFLFFLFFSFLFFSFLFFPFLFFSFLFFSFLSLLLKLCFCLVPWLTVHASWWLCATTAATAPCRRRRFLAYPPDQEQQQALPLPVAKWSKPRDCPCPLPLPWDLSKAAPG